MLEFTCLSLSLLQHALWTSKFSYEIEQEKDCTGLNEITWEEETVAYFKALSQNLPGGTKENHGKQPSGLESSSGQPEYEAELPTTELWRSVLDSGNEK
jgi:hypothetical protein